jgi:hypothetical protein
MAKSKRAKSKKRRGASTPQPPGPGTRLVLQPAKRACCQLLGLTPVRMTVRAGQKVVHTLHLANTGQEAATIAKPHLDEAGWMHADVSAHVIPPDSSIEVRLTADLTSTQLPASVYPNRLHISYEGDDGPLAIEPVEVRTRVIVTRVALMVTPEVQQLEDLMPGDKQAIRFEVRRADGQPPQANLRDAPRRWVVRADQQALSEENGQVFEVEVRVPEDFTPHGVNAADQLPASARLREEEGILKVELTLDFAEPPGRFSEPVQAIASVAAARYPMPVVLARRNGPELRGSVDLGVNYPGWTRVHPCYIRNEGSLECLVEPEAVEGYITECEPRRVRIKPQQTEVVNVSFRIPSKRITFNRKNPWPTHSTLALKWRSSGGSGPIRTKEVRFEHRRPLAFPCHVRERARAAATDLAISSATVGIGLVAIWLLLGQFGVIAVGLEVARRVPALSFIPGPLLALVMGVAVVHELSGLYYMLLRRGTPGMRLNHCVLRTMRGGRPLSVPTALWRTLLHLAMVFGLLGLVTIRSDAYGRPLQEVLSGTIMVTEATRLE